jgi:chaperonin GroES
MKITPLFDRLLVKQIETTQSAGGIFIPPSCLEKPQIAKVLSVGNGIEQNGETVKMVVKPGDTVVYSKYAGSEITLENEKLILIKQCDILGLLL